MRPLTSAGVLSGAGLLLLGGLLLAAGRLPQNPDRVLAAMIGRVRFDERIERLDKMTRRSVLCVALAIGMEARGEPAEGQAAVAHVIRTRMRERGLDGCATVYQPYQFSWSSYPIEQQIIRDDAAWMLAQDIAYRVMIDGAADPTNGANHFFAYRQVNPRWARGRPQQKIGGHSFLRIG